ncbi:MAG: hypothetical protein HYT30_01285 [Parcubacteria group bacterium]|nr:hypothetical protein [Parcubacteria group bacterium]
MELVACAPRGDLEKTQQARNVLRQRVEGGHFPFVLYVERECFVIKDASTWEQFRNQIAPKIAGVESAWAVKNLQVAA